MVSGGFKAAKGILDLGDTSSEQLIGELRGHSPSEDERTLMYVYAEYNPNWIYYGWHLYLAPMENGIPNRHGFGHVWLGRYDWMLDEVLKVLGIAVIPGDEYGKRTERFMKAYPAGVLVWSSRNNHEFEVVTGCGVEVWECFRAVRADREKDWYNDRDHPVKWRDRFLCANAEKRKRKQERDRAILMIVDAVSASQREKRQSAKMRKMNKDAKALMTYVQHKIGCAKANNHLKKCTCGVEAVVEAARANGWVKAKQMREG